MQDPSFFPHPITHPLLLLRLYKIIRHCHPEIAGAGAAVAFEVEVGAVGEDAALLVGEGIDGIERDHHLFIK